MDYEQLYSTATKALNTEIEKNEQLKQEWDNTEKLYIEEIKRLKEEAGHKKGRYTGELQDEIKKQSDFLTLVRLRFSESVSATRQFHYPEALCKNQPPEQFNGFNACLSCPMTEICRLLYAEPKV